jgi:hypothetical protein
MTQKLLYDALFGPEDPTSLMMKTEKPTQSHRNITQRWLMNFCPRIFHQTIPCGFSKMVLRPTQQWLASLWRIKYTRMPCTSHARGGRIYFECAGKI